MPKRRVCKEREAEWAWQPLGPAEAPRETFTVPGYFYRGFPVIPVCDDCKEKIQAGETVEFEYKGVSFTCVDEEVLEGNRVA